MSFLHNVMVLKLWSSLHDTFLYWTRQYFGIFWSLQPLPAYTHTPIYPLKDTILAYLFLSNMKYEVLRLSWTMLKRGGIIYSISYLVTAFRCFANSFSGSLTLGRLKLGENSEVLDSVSSAVGEVKEHTLSLWVTRSMARLNRFRLRSQWISRLIFNIKFHPFPHYAGVVKLG